MPNSGRRTDLDARLKFVPWNEEAVGQESQQLFVLRLCLRNRLGLIETGEDRTSSDRSWLWGA